MTLTCCICMSWLLVPPNSPLWASNFCLRSSLSCSIWVICSLIVATCCSTSAWAGVAPSCGAASVSLLALSSSNCLLKASAWSLYFRPIFLNYTGVQIYMYIVGLRKSWSLWRHTCIKFFYIHVQYISKNLTLFIGNISKKKTWLIVFDFSSLSLVISSTFSFNFWVSVL